MRQRPRPPALLPRRPRPLRLLPPRRPPRPRRNRRASRRHAKAARPRAANGPPCRPGTRSCSVARASETSHRTFSASGRAGSAVSWRSSGPETRGMQRVSQDPCRLTRVAVGRGAPAPDGQRFESHHIDRFRRHGQPVAGRVRLDHVTDSALAQLGPQPGNQRLQRVTGVARRVVRPDPASALTDRPYFCWHSPDHSTRRITLRFLSRQVLISTVAGERRR
jgi:hypothetical protein